LSCIVGAAGVSNIIFESLALVFLMADGMRQRARD
jgi:hypothetical protein